MCIWIINRAYQPHKQARPMVKGIARVDGAEARSRAKRVPSRAMEVRELRQERLSAQQTSTFPTDGLSRRQMILPRQLHRCGTAPATHNQRVQIGSANGMRQGEQFSVSEAAAAARGDGVAAQEVTHRTL